MVAGVPEVHGLFSKCSTIFDTFRSKVKVMGVIVLGFLGDFLLGSPQFGFLISSRIDFRAF